MQYQYSFIEYQKILSDAEKALLQDLSEKYTFAQFVQDSRNFKELAIDFVYTSAKIKGNTYERVDTDNLLRLGITAGGKRYSDAVMLLNLKEAYNKIINIDFYNLVNYEYLCNLHKIITQKLLPDFEQGTIRDLPVRFKEQFTKYKPLPNNNNSVIHEELKHLFNNANLFNNPFEQAIYLHCNLAYLQCFIEGNKRTARLMQDAVLVRSDNLPLFFSDSLIDDYQRALAQYYETGEYKAYVDFFIKNYSLVINNLTNN